MQKAFFFDRDGVINEKAEPHCYITSWDKFVFKADIFKIMRYVIGQGYIIIIVSNQRGIGRSIMSYQDVLSIHRKMIEVFSIEGITITDIFICPHDISNHCDCRKPKPGLFVKAIKRYSIDAARSYMLGDSESDLIAANAVNITPILLSKDKVDSIEFPYLLIKDLKEILLLI